MTAHRYVQVRWEGDLPHGSGWAARSSSSVLDDTPVSWPARSTAGEPAGTSPEELLAMAHASCYAMSLAHELGQLDAVAQSIEVTCTISFEKRDGKWEIARSALDVIADVPGIDEAMFIGVCEKVKEACPVSRALAGNIDITLDASLSVEQLAAAAGP